MVSIHQCLTNEVPPTVTAPATSPPPVTPGPPERGNYNVTNATGTVCLLARMGLQLNISYHLSSSGKVFFAHLKLILHEFVSNKPSLQNLHKGLVHPRMKSVSTHLKGEDFFTFHCLSHTKLICLCNIVHTSNELIFFCCKSSLTF